MTLTLKKKHFEFNIHERIDAKVILWEYQSRWKSYKNKHIM
jgi:hypothetical protein